MCTYFQVLWTSFCYLHFAAAYSLPPLNHFNSRKSEKNAFVVVFMLVVSTNHKSHESMWSERNFQASDLILIQCQEDDMRRILPGLNESYFVNFNQIFTTLFMLQKIRYKTLNAKSLFSLSLQKLLELPRSV